MVLSFSVGNFRSFREVQTFNMMATDKKPRFEFQNDNLIPVTDKIAGLKVNVAYGANGSGKSNLIQAFIEFIHICKKSLVGPSALQGLVPFLLADDSPKQPTFFEIVVAAEGIIYRYGFEADTKRFHSEWLYVEENGHEEMYFDRSKEGVNINDRSFSEGRKIMSSLDPEVSTLDDDKLLLSLGILQKSKTLLRLQAALEKIIMVENELGDHLHGLAMEMLRDQDVRQKTAKLLNNLSVDVDYILHTGVAEDQEFIKDSGAAIDSLNDKIIFGHIMGKNPDGKDKVSAWLMESLESAGTQRLTLLAPYLLATVAKGYTLIIDEFESRLHTNLSRAIIEMFIEPDSNPNNGQLIVATHDTNLLSANLLRRDQITFLQKKEDKSTEIFRLSDIKGVRSDRSHEKDYLTGRYEAIPNIDRLIFTE